MQKKQFAIILLRKDRNFPALSVATEFLFFVAPPFPIGSFPRLCPWWHSQVSALSLPGAIRKTQPSPSL